MNILNTGHVQTCFEMCALVSGIKNSQKGNGPSRKQVTETKIVIQESGRWGVCSKCHYLAVEKCAKIIVN